MSALKLLLPALIAAAAPGGYIIITKGMMKQLRNEAELAAPTKELYARGLDKSDEFEADRMGVLRATRAFMKSVKPQSAMSQREDMQVETDGDRDFAATRSLRNTGN